MPHQKMIVAPDFMARYPVLQHDSELFSSLEMGGLQRLEASYGKEALEKALDDFVKMAQKIRHEVKAEYGVVPQMHPTVDDLKLSLDVRAPSPEGITQLVEAALLGAACHIRAANDWGEFCRKQFSGLDEADRQGVIDGLKLWYVNVTAPVGAQYDKAQFLFSPGDREEIRRIVDHFKAELSPLERARLTQHLFLAAEVSSLKGIDTSQSYPNVVSQIFSKNQRSTLISQINQLCSLLNLDIVIPDNASLLTYKFIAGYLDNKLGGYVSDSKLPENASMAAIVEIAKHRALYASYLAKKFTAIENEYFEAGFPEAALPDFSVDKPGQTTSEKYQRSIDAIVALPEDEKRRRLMEKHRRVSQLEIEQRFGRCGFTFEEREALGDYLSTDKLPNLKIMEIKKAARELRDSLERENRAEGVNYQEQVIPSAIALVNIFGTDWRRWLDLNAQYNIGAHDATYWLPMNYSPEQIRGRQGDNETKGVPWLGQFLFKHRWSQNGEITTMLADGKQKRGEPREIQELSIIARNWGALNTEDKQKPFANILAVCISHKYTDIRHQEFAREAAFQGISKETYRDMETLYLSAQRVPEPFDTQKRFQMGSLIGRFLPRKDVRTGFFGGYVDCCQHLVGTGYEPAIATMADPYSQLFVVEDEKGKIVGGAMVWRRLEPVVGHPGQYAMSACFDSVELKGITTQVGVTEESQRTLGIRKRQQENTEIHRQLAKWLTEECGFQRVTAATAYNTMDKEYLDTLPVLDEKDNLTLPPAYQGRYSDAKQQYLMAENRHPKLFDGAVITPEVWVRGFVESKDRVDNDKKQMDAIAKQVYPKGFQRMDTAESEKQTTLLLMRNHPDPAKKSGVIGYAVIDDENKYLVDLAVDPQCRGDSLMLLKRVFDHCEEVGGTWSAHARESSTLKLLELVERRGRIKLHREHDPNKLAKDDVAHAVSFEIIPCKKAAYLNDSPTCDIKPSAGMEREALVAYAVQRL